MNVINTTKKRIILIASIVVLVATGFLVSKLQNVSSKIDFVVAERGDLLQTVSVTGRVKPTQSVDLAFEKTGRISWMHAEIGDQAVRGEALAGLENRDIEAKFESSKAVRRSEEAKLEELLAGTRPEEIRVQEVKVENAQKALEDEEISAIDVVRDAYTKSDDAIRNKVDQFIANPQSATPDIDFPITNTQLEIDIETTRVTTEELLNAWNASLLGLTPKSDLNTFIKNGRTNLLSAKSFLEDIALAVNALKASIDFSQTTIDGYRADVSVARANVNTAIANLSAADESMRDAESTLALAKEELVLKQAGARAEKITAQQAKVEESRASVNNYKAERDKTILFSPITGIVTKQEAEVGEIVTANTNIISLISADQFEIETNIPESDIAKLEIGAKYICLCRRIWNDNNAVKIKK